MTRWVGCIFSGSAAGGPGKCSKLFPEEQLPTAPQPQPGGQRTKHQGIVQTHTYHLTVGSSVWILLHYYGMIKYKSWNCCLPCTQACSFFNSNAVPLKLALVNADPLGEEINVMFKVQHTLLLDAGHLRIRFLHCDNYSNIQWLSWLPLVAEMVSRL